MASIIPFRGIRATREHIEKFAAAAFDADVREEIIKHSLENRYSSMHILNPQLIAAGDHPDYDAPREHLQRMLGEGVLEQEEKPSLYIYRQVKHNNVFTCIIGLADMKEYMMDSIKRHELTRPDKEDKISEFFSKVKLNGAPVLLTYKHSPVIQNLIEELVEPAPAYHFTGEDHVEHSLWPVSDEAAVKDLQDHFSKIDALYVADGHHRCAALSALYPGTSEFLACFISSEQVLIHGFHRMVKDLSGLNAEKFIEALKMQGFEITEAGEDWDDSPGVLHVYTGAKWYRVGIPEFMKSKANPKHNLDVYILDRYIFGDILNIKDTRTSSRIKYMNGEVQHSALTAPVDRGEMAAVFTLYPLSPEEVMLVSDAGETLPPKSTWIEPKLRSGLVIHSFGN
jgi:uncharacterized protein (DUF1015 family)